MCVCVLTEKNENIECDKSYCIYRNILGHLVQYTYRLVDGLMVIFFNLQQALHSCNCFYHCYFLFYFDDFLTNDHNDPRRSILRTIKKSSSRATRSRGNNFVLTYLNVAKIRRLSRKRLITQKPFDILLNVNIIYCMYI